MKKQLLMLTVAAGLCTNFAIGQGYKVTTAWSYLQNKDYDKAKEAINIAAANDATKDEAKTWLYRGQIYGGIYTSTLQSLASKTQGKNPDPSAVKAYNNYIISNTDLKESALSYAKAVQLDAQKKDFPEAYDYLFAAAVALYNDGYNCFQFQKYPESLEKFNEFEDSYKALGDQSKRVDQAFTKQSPPGDVRSAYLFMAGCELQLKNYDQAKADLKTLMDSKYPDQTVYINLSNLDLRDKDTAQAIAVLDKGIEILPDSAALLMNKLNIYTRQKKTTEALQLCEAAIKKSPKNVQLYILEASLYVDQKQYDKAKDIFKQALAMDPNNFGVASNIGLLKYNQGVEIFNKSLDANGAESDKYLAQAKDIWKDAIKDLEASLTLPRTDADFNYLHETYDALSRMYYHLDDVTNGKKYKDLARGQ